MQSQTARVDKKVIGDSLEAKQESDSIESLELIGDKEFMSSYCKSKEQIRKREFGDWSKL